MVKHVCDVNLIRYFSKEYASVEAYRISRYVKSSLKDVLKCLRRGKRNGVFLQVRRFKSKRRIFCGVKKYFGALSATKGVFYEKTFGFIFIRRGGV